MPLIIKVLLEICLWGHGSRDAGIGEGGWGHAAGYGPGTSLTVRFLWLLDFGVDPSVREEGVIICKLAVHVLKAWLSEGMPGLKPGHF